MDEGTRYTIPFLLVRDDTYKCLLAALTYVTVSPSLSMFYRCTPPSIGYAGIFAATINIYSVSICNNFNSYMEHYLLY